MAETWTYIDSNTIEITGDLTAKYWPNQLIKITQGTEKFFVVTAVALVSGNTRLTVSGGGIYTLTSDTITSHYMTTNAAPNGLPLGFAEQGKAYGAASKDIPEDADRLSIWDSAANFVQKRITLSNIKSALKSYFDEIYVAIDDLTEILEDLTDTLENALTDYVKLAGRPGGQTIQGGTGSGNSLELESTSNATKGNVRVMSGTTTLLNIDASGRVSQPLNPAFVARFSSGTINPGNYIVWNYVETNIGNCYNSSTGKFTAPIAGLYEFGFNILLNNAGSGEYRHGFYLNNGNYNTIIKTKSANTWETIQGTIQVYLNANDVVGIFYTSGNGAAYNDPYYNRFWGRLVG